MRIVLPISLLLVVFAAVSCSEPTNTNVAVNSANNATASRPNATTADQKDEGRDAPRISLVDAKKHFDEKTAVFIDTHPANQFELEHIPGAINIQPNTIRQNLDKVPKGKKIIVYCS